MTRKATAKPFKAWMLFARGARPKFALMGRVFPSKENATSYLRTNQLPEEWYPARVEVKPL